MKYQLKDLDIYKKVDNYIVDVKNGKFVLVKNNRRVIGD